jgi:hypothetical protein
MMPPLAINMVDRCNAKHLESCSQTETWVVGDGHVSSFSNDHTESSWPLSNLPHIERARKLMRPGHGDGIVL